jgi:hypothetical protein
MLCFGGAVPSDPPGLPSHEVSLQAAMFISPMSALTRTTDSGRTASDVSNVPFPDSCSAANSTHGCNVYAITLSARASSERHGKAERDGGLEIDGESRRRVVRRECAVPVQDFDKLARKLAEIPSIGRRTCWLDKDMSLR